VSYGGRDEIVFAARQLARQVAHGAIAADAIDAAAFSEHLYLPDVPDPDLLIRTSDERRISNFLLWQLAYSEIVVTPVLWPDFSPQEFHRCLAEFAGRERRFGLTEEQIRSGR
jgi:undecaprenyl diphosphate synthase